MCSVARHVVWDDHLPFTFLLCWVSFHLTTWQPASVLRGPNLTSTYLSAKECEHSSEVTARNEFLSNGSDFIIQWGKSHLAVYPNSLITKEATCRISQTSQHRKVLQKCIIIELIFSWCLFHHVWLSDDSFPVSLIFISIIFIVIYIL